MKMKYNWLILLSWLSSPTSSFRFSNKNANAPNLIQKAYFKDEVFKF